MKKFLAIYRMDMAKIAELMATMSEEQRKQDMAEWGAWMQKNATHFADAGGPLGKNTEVTTGGAIEKSNDIAGYSIINAESKEAALALLADGPHLKMPGSTTDVMEVMAM